MKNRIKIFSLVMILSTLACTISLNSPPSPTQTPIVLVVTSTPLPASETPLASLTPLATLTLFPSATFTPTVPTVAPKDVPVNCRYGPGQEWLVVSGLALGQTSQIVGKNSKETWWYIVDPNDSSRNCWVAVSVTIASGNLSGLPVVQTPKALVTKVTVSVDPKSISVPGCFGPIQPFKIKGTITVNGPITVKWHFATQKDGAMPTNTTEFNAYGNKDFSIEYTPPVSAGTYWIRLIVTEPNDIQGEGNYKIICS